MVDYRVSRARARRLAIVLSGIVLIAGICADPADARGRRKRSYSSYQPPYAAIVVDANSGEVLHSSNPDASRHPASLTKIMTLYLLFEQLEAGKVKLDTPFEVSEHAASQAPSKLGVRPGQTITAEDAIKALVTKSANDAAVVVAEALAGDEDDFAKRMTRKARALGMSRTTYTNASGLPDPDQVTTARDQSLLGRAIQDRFPRYYRYFATPSFTYRGVAMRNHNKLLGNVAGVDGIKTGYTRASGFNLVTSMRRGNRHVVAVVLGGASGGQRDARMRSLLDTHIMAASTQRTATKIAEAPEPRITRPVTVALQPVAAPATTAPAAAPLAPQAIVTTAREDALPTSSIRPGSEEPLQPLTVKTISVHAGSTNAVAFRAVAVPTSLASSAPRALSASEPTPPPAPVVRTAVAEPPAKPGPVAPAPALAPEKEGGMSLASAASAPVLAPVASPAIAAHRGIKVGEWAIQVGAFPDETEARERLKVAQNLAKSLLAKADPYTERVQKGSQKLYRARFAGLDQGTAETACKYFKRNDIACMALKN